VGGFAVRHAINKGSSNGKSFTSIPALPGAPSSNPNANEDLMTEFEKSSKSVLEQKMDAPLTEADFDKIAEVRTLINSGDNMWKYHPANEILKAIDGLIQSVETQNDLIDLIAKKDPIDFEAWRQSSFWNSSGGDAYSKLITDDALRDRIANSMWPREKFEDIVTYVDRGEYKSAFSQVEQLILDIKRDDKMSPYYQQAFNQLLEKYQNDQMGVYLALKRIELPLEPDADKLAAATNAIKEEFEVAIRDDVANLGDILIISPSNVDKVERTIERLDLNRSGYLGFANFDPDLVKSARDQRDSSARRLNRFRILKEKTEDDFNTSIKNFSGLAHPLPIEQLETLLQFADTFIDENRDTRKLHQFRLTVGPIVLEHYKKIENSDKLDGAYRNRIKDLIKALKSRDLSLYNPKPNTKVSVEFATQTQTQLDQLNKFITAYTDYGYDEENIDDIEIAAREQFTKTRELLKDAQA
jgi:hypothetical protein